MDEHSRKEFESDLNDFEGGIYESSMDTETKNAFLKVSKFLSTMHDDTQMAHLRIDHRKDEMKAMKDSIDSLSDNVGKMAERIQSLTKAQAGIMGMINKQIAMNEARFDAEERRQKRITIYITVVSVISMIGTFGSIKGASIAASIWGVIGKLL